jgi:PIN domain nuclease of toxin-antitoxin system
MNAGSMAWSRRDPAGRLIAATALFRGTKIVTADAAADRVLSRIWRERLRISQSGIRSK